MENLRDKLDSLSIEQLFEGVKDFIRSAENYDNSLKLVIVLTQIMQECTSLLSNIDKDDYESTVCERIGKVTAECEEMLVDYERENMANKSLVALADGAQRGILAEKIDSIGKQINDVKDMLKQLMKIRENTPVGKRI